MYERETNSAHNVEWNPDDAALAEQAMNDVDGTGVPGTHNLPDEANVPVEAEVAQSVRERYNDLLADRLELALGDGEVTGDGIDAESVTVTVRDVNGNVSAGGFVVLVSVNGTERRVSVEDGAGTFEVTTSADAGSTVTVEATGVADPDVTATASAQKTIDVV